MPVEVDFVITGGTVRTRAALFEAELARATTWAERELGEFNPHCS